MPNQPIKVLHPITRLIVGGAQENTMYTAACLDRQRFHVEVLTGPQTGSEGSLIEEVRQRGIPLTILPELHREINPWLDLQALAAMSRFMRRGQFPIVHTHSSKAGILGRLAARMAKIPIIIHTVHGWSFHDYMSSTKNGLYRLLEAWVARFTDALIVVTERDISKGLQAGIGVREKYHLIRSAIPLDEFMPADQERSLARLELRLPAEAIVVGNVGRFSAQKNPIDWVRAAGKIGRDCPQAHFLLVGDGPLRTQVEEELHRQGIADRAILTGLRRDVSRMLSAMDIFMLSSLWEGLPRVIPQAMAMRLPVVANRADGTCEVIEEGITGYLCPPGEVEQLADYCLQLIFDPLKRQEMGVKGRRFILQEFDLRRMISQIEELYEYLLSR